MDDEVILEYSIDGIDARGFTLSYSIVNGSGRPIFVLSPLAEVGLTKTDPSPQKVYTFVDEEGVFHITKRLWEVPEDIDVYAPEVPYVTRVPAGGRLDERISCSLPMRVQYPYRFDDPEPGSEAEEPKLVTVTSTAVAFSIGYLDLPEEKLKLESAPEAGGSGFLVSYGVAAENQLLLEGEPVDLRVPVQDTA